MEQPGQLDIDDTTLAADIDRLFNGFVTGTFTMVPTTASSDMTDLSGGRGVSAPTQQLHGQATPPTTTASSQHISQVSQYEQSSTEKLQTAAPFGQTWDAAREQMLIDVLSVVANPVSSCPALSSLQPDDRAQTSQSSVLAERSGCVLPTNMALSGFNGPAQSSTSVPQQDLYTATQNSGSNLPALSPLSELIQDCECPVGTNGKDTGQESSMSSFDALETVQLQDVAMMDAVHHVTEGNSTNQGTPHHSSGTSCQTRSQTRNKLRRTRSRVSESSVDETSQEYKEYLKTLDPQERKRELNRRAAKRCRDKKYEKELELEAQAKELREQHTELLRVKAQLQEESNSIASNLRKHSFCLKR